MIVTQKTPPLLRAHEFSIVPTRPARRATWKWIILAAVLAGSVALTGAYLRPSPGDAGEAPRSDGAVVRPVRLGVLVGGRVAAVHVQAGQAVEPGQVLVTLEAHERIARRDQARSRLASAEAALRRALAGAVPEEVAEAKAAAEAARARLEKAKAGPRPEQRRKAQAERDAALADQTLAEADFDRAERLLARKALLQADYDTARAARDRTRHKVAAAQAVLDELLHGSRPEDIAEAQAKYDHDLRHYELVRRGTRAEEQDAARAAVALAQAQLAEAEAALREATVTAAERCVIVELLVRPGSVLAAGQAVVVAQ